ncbi:hypothetical protein [Dactylosporangium sp. CA-092794]|uniref:hypothetical protein n=1 Tax=Dactylosporangium sp. CA-092794 TaxID=3239929 RepID=UPI003D8C0503
MLPGLYRDCEENLVRTRQGIAERVRTSGAPGIVLNESAVRVRSDIADVLSSWCALVVQERRPARRPRSRAAADLTAFLDPHVDWLARHPAAGDFAAEVHALTAVARRVSDRTDQDPRTLGRCDRQGCGSSVHLYDGADGTARQARCTAGHVWQPHEWLRLSRGNAARDAERAA